MENQPGIGVIGKRMGKRRPAAKQPPNHPTRIEQKPRPRGQRFEKEDLEYIQSLFNDEADYKKFNIVYDQVNNMSEDELRKYGFQGAINFMRSTVRIEKNE